MNDQQQLVLLRLREKVDRALEHELEPAARDFLLAELANCSSVKSTVIGNMSEPDVATMVAEAWATPGGQRLAEVMKESEAHRDNHAATEQEARLAEIQAIQNPRERINAARKAGLA